MRPSVAAFARSAFVMISAAIYAPCAAHEGENEFFDLDLEQLMSLTVTSVAKKEQQLADTAAAVFIITQEDIRRSGATCIPEALAMAPGLHVARISASKWSVSSRGFAGFSSNKLLVLIDGRSVYSPAYSGTFWDQQQTLLEDIERIEVIRGPGGSLWGTNAVNGVINIITKRAEDTQGTLVRLGVGSEQPYAMAARWGGSLGVAGHGRFYLSTDSYAPNELSGTGLDAGDAWHPFQGGFRFDGGEAGADEWTVQGDIYRNSGDQLVFPYWTPVVPYMTSLNDEVRTTGGNILSRWRRQVPSSGGYLTAKAYYDYAARDEASYQFDYRTLDVDLQYEQDVGMWQSLVMGLGHRHIDGDFTPSYLVRVPDHNDDLDSAFFQDEIELSAERLWLTLGSKYEHNDYSGSEWQPSARVLWKPDKRQSVWASLARAVRTPSIMEQYGRLVVGLYPTEKGMAEAAFVGDANFDAEILWAYEVGYRRQLSQRLSVDLALFVNDYDDIYTISPTVTDRGYELHFANALEGRGYGGELVLDWKATSILSFAATYSYLDLDLSPEGRSRGLLRDLAINESSPRQQFGIRSSLLLTEGWRVNMWLRYIDHIKGWSRSDLQSLPLVVDACWLADVNLIWNLRKNLELMLGGHYLLNSSQLQYVSEYATPPTEVERSVYARVSWRF